MKIGLIGAMEEEIEILKISIQEAKESECYGYHFIEGKLGQHDVVLVKSGIGKVNAAISTVLMVEKFQVEAVINTGSAGATDPSLKVGDVVISHSVAHHDVDVTAFGYKYGQMAGMPEVYYPDTQLVRTCQLACRSMNIEPCIGLIVSGDQFVNSTERIDLIREHFPNVRACEMEAAAIAQTAYVLNVPFVIVRAISDSADEKASISFDQFIKLAGKSSAQMVIQLINLLD